MERLHFKSKITNTKLKYIIENIPNYQDYKRGEILCNQAKRKGKEKTMIYNNIEL